MVFVSKESTSGQQDPHAQREADKYENPIPSREFILEALEEAQKPLRLYQVAKIVDVDEDDEERFEALSRRMKAMVRDGQLIRNRRGAFGLLKKMDLIKGRVLGHPDGYGFLVPDEGGKDLFLSEKEMHKVLHGDIVIASVIGEDRRGRQEGAIVEVTEHNTTQVLGRLNHEDGLSWVRPNNNRLTQDIFIPKDGLLEAKEEQVVLVEVLHQPTARSGPIGKIVDVVGDYMSAGMEIESAIHAYGIPNSWNEELEADLAKIPEQGIEYDLKWIVVLQTVGVFAVAAVSRSAGRLHVGSFPRFRSQGAEQGGGVESSGADFHIVRLLDDTTLFSPEPVQFHDDVLKIHGLLLINGWQSLLRIHFLERYYLLIALQCRKSFLAILL